MDVNQFYETLDSYFARQETDKVGPFLVSSLEQAKDEEDYGAYISICNEMIGFYRSVSAFEKAYAAAEDVLLLMEELQLDHTEHFATTLLNTATAYRAAGDFAQALRLYRQALQIYEGLLPPDDYRYAGLYNNMSILLEKMDENEEAAECAKKALAIIEKLEGGESETATTLTNLALIYFKMEKADEVKELLERAIALFENPRGTGESIRTDGDAGTGMDDGKAVDASGGTDAHYSGALAGVGETYFRMGEYDKALLYYEKALTEVKAHFGENMSYAILCENCAAVCGQLGDAQKQKAYLEKAERVKREIG